LLYPISDIFFTDINKPPYTFAVFGSLVLSLPFLIGYGFEGLINKKQKIILYLINFIIILQMILFLRNYYNYPLYSSDYWGWQYGPKVIINYFKIQSKNYNELYMTGNFNAPEIFLQFYDPKRECKNCFIGSIDNYNSSKKQLFALRVEEFKHVKLNYKLKNIIYYPNGKKAFYIIEPSS